MSDPFESEAYKRYISPIEERLARAMGLAVEVTPTAYPGGTSYHIKATGQVNTEHGLKNVEQGIALTVSNITGNVMYRGKSVTEYAHSDEEFINRTIGQFSAGNYQIGYWGSGTPAPQHQKSMSSGEALSRATGGARPRASTAEQPPEGFAPGVEVVGGPISANYDVPISIENFRTDAEGIAQRYGFGYSDVTAHSLYTQQLREGAHPLDAFERTVQSLNQQRTQYQVQTAQQMSGIRRMRSLPPGAGVAASPTTSGIYSNVGAAAPPPPAAAGGAGNSGGLPPGVTTGSPPGGGAPPPDDPNDYSSYYSSGGGSGQDWTTLELANAVGGAMAQASPRAMKAYFEEQRAGQQRMWASRMPVSAISTVAQTAQFGTTELQRNMELLNESIKKTTENFQPLSSSTKDLMGSMREQIRTIDRYQKSLERQTDALEGHQLDLEREYAKESYGALSESHPRKQNFRERQAALLGAIRENEAAKDIFAGFTGVDPISGERIQGRPDLGAQKMIMESQLLSMEAAQIAAQNQPGVRGWLARRQAGMDAAGGFWYGGLGQVGWTMFNLQRWWDYTGGALSSMGAQAAAGQQSMYGALYAMGYDLETAPGLENQRSQAFAVEQFKERLGTSYNEQVAPVVSGAFQRLNNIPEGAFDVLPWAIMGAGVAGVSQIGATAASRLLAIPGLSNLGGVKGPMWLLNKGLNAAGILRAEQAFNLAALPASVAGPATTVGTNAPGMGAGIVDDVLEAFRVAATGGEATVGGVAEAGTNISRLGRFGSLWRGVGIASSMLDLGYREYQLNRDVFDETLPESRGTLANLASYLPASARTAWYQGLLGGFDVARPLMQQFAPGLTEKLFTEEELARAPIQQRLAAIPGDISNWYQDSGVVAGIKQSQTRYDDASQQRKILEMVGNALPIPLGSAAKSGFLGGLSAARPLLEWLAPDSSLNELFTDEERDKENWWERFKSFLSGDSGQASVSGGRGKSVPGMQSQITPRGIPSEYLPMINMPGTGQFQGGGASMMPGDPNDPYNQVNAKAEQLLGQYFPDQLTRGRVLTQLLNFNGGVMPSDEQISEFGEKLSGLSTSETGKALEAMGSIYSRLGIVPGTPAARRLYSEWGLIPSAKQGAYTSAAGMIGPLAQSQLWGTDKIIQEMNAMVGELGLGEDANFMNLQLQRQAGNTAMTAAFGFPAGMPGTGVIRLLGGMNAQQENVSAQWVNMIRPTASAGGIVDQFDVEALGGRLSSLATGLDEAGASTGMPALGVDWALKYVQAQFGQLGLATGAGIIDTGLQRQTERSLFSDIATTPLTRIAERVARAGSIGNVLSSSNLSEQRRSQIITQLARGNVSKASRVAAMLAGGDAASWSLGGAPYFREMLEQYGEEDDPRLQEGFVPQVDMLGNPYYRFHSFSFGGETVGPTAQTETNLSILGGRLNLANAQFGIYQRGWQMRNIQREYGTPGSGGGLAQEEFELRHQMQQEGFQYQQAQLNLQRQSLELTKEEYRIRREYQLEERDEGRGMQMLQRQWWMEDLGIGQNQFETQAGWQREDLDRALRYSTGRQRFDLMRRSERLDVTDNWKREEFVRTRQRQEQTWAYEDERFDKGVQFEQEINAIQEQRFALQQAGIDLQQDHLNKQIDAATKMKDIDQQRLDDQTEYQQGQLVHLGKIQDLEIKRLEEQTKFTTAMEVWVKAMQANYESWVRWFENHNPNDGDDGDDDGGGEEVFDPIKNRGEEETGGGNIDISKPPIIRPPGSGFQRDSIVLPPGRNPGIPSNLPTNNGMAFYLTLNIDGETIAESMWFLDGFRQVRSLEANL